MPINSAQRADIGVRYVGEIRRRIKIRTDAKTKVRPLPGKENAEVLAAAQLDLVDIVGTRHLLPPVKQVVASTYPDGFYTFHFKGGDEDERRFQISGIPAKRAVRVAALLSYSSAEEAAKKKNQSLCQELEFLNEAMGGSAIGGFQSYCARLWSPAGKAERLPDSEFKAHLEAFLNTRRGFTCPL